MVVRAHALSWTRVCKLWANSWNPTHAHLPTTYVFTHTYLYIVWEKSSAMGGIRTRAFYASKCPHIPKTPAPTTCTSRTKTEHKTHIPLRRTGHYARGGGAQCGGKLGGGRDGLFRGLLYAFFHACFFLEPGHAAGVWCMCVRVCVCVRARP